MSLPAFNGTALFTRAGRDLPGGIAARYYAEALPGLDGRFVQPHGAGERHILSRGALQADGGTPAQAHQQLKADLRARQSLADGRTVAGYLGADGHSYPNCMLVSYEPLGETSVSASGPPFTATVFAVARVLQLTP